MHQGNPKTEAHQNKCFTGTRLQGFSICVEKKKREEMISPSPEKRKNVKIASRYLLKGREGQFANKS